MTGTPFPARPRDVAALNAQEFAVDLERDAPSIDVVCGKFVDDVNRALVWLIRFRALQAWCARADMMAWLHAGPGTSRDVCEVAAHFELNDHWEFDTDNFRSAIESVIAQRLGCGNSRGSSGGSVFQ